jgi:hypothetical protein
MKKTIRTLLFAGLALLATSCAARPGAPAAAVQASAAETAQGLYQFEARTEEQPDPLPGQIRIEASEGRYSGFVLTDIFPPIPVTTVAREGEALRIVGTTREGELVFRLTMNGERFTGTWSTSDGMRGTVTGTRRPLQ